MKQKFMLSAIMILAVLLSGQSVYAAEVDAVNGIDAEPFENTGPVWGLYEFVENASVTVTDIVVSCDGENATATLNLSADNAKRYLLSRDSALSAASWELLTDGSVSVDWTFDVASGTAEIFYMFDSVHDNATRLKSMNIDLGDLEFCNDAEVEETPSFVMKKSPYNGEFEIVTPVEEDDLIVGENFDTVYLLDDGVRRPFMNEPIYYTWYNFQSDVKTVTDATLGDIPLGAPMLPKPRGKMVKVTSSPTVYFILENGGDGQLLPLKDEEHAQKVGGSLWMDNVIDIDETLFVRFERA
ncbi:hypothetical protein HQ524_01420 [Candidatus Uhrbacteria bacterium]|nr:hypothetical protein [Candidatus Uhrbacteria bacterium]